MRQKYRGFTLVELLVVIAIIGILVALLLPAIQAAREAARRSECINNLKQLGISMQNFHDTKKQLPAGSYTCCYGTWQMLILPFIEEQQLADMYSYAPKNLPIYDPRYSYDSNNTTLNPPVRNLQVCSTRIPTLTCPSDDKQVRSTGITLHNYVVNYGNTDYRRNTITDANGTKIQHLGAPFVLNDFNPPYPDIEVKFREITDGLSKTLLASETVQGDQGQDGDARALTWWGFGAGFQTFDPPNSSLPDFTQGPNSCNAEAPNPPCAKEGAGGLARAAARSRHPGGVNVAMCDGSVHYVVDDIDLPVWRGASTTKGQEVYSGLTN
ncbi:MAG: DUF1559 domain-containing protein [Pirellulales bacterium]